MKALREELKNIDNILYTDKILFDFYTEENAIELNYCYNNEAIVCTITEGGAFYIRLECAIKCRVIDIYDNESDNSNFIYLMDTLHKNKDKIIETVKKYIEC